jgi:hypothetical protein
MDHYSPNQKARRVLSFCNYISKRCASAQHLGCGFFGEWRESLELIRSCKIGITLVNGNIAKRYPYCNNFTGAIEMNSKRERTRRELYLSM